MSSFTIAFLLVSIGFSIANTTGVPPVRVLYDRQGTLTYGTVTTARSNTPTSPTLSIYSDYYISSVNRSPRNDVVPRENLSYELPQIQATYQEQQHVLQKGVIVLGKDKKPYLVEAVFPNNKVVLYPLGFNHSSISYDEEQNTIFRRLERQNVQIVSTSDILSVQQSCYLKKYCKGQKLEKIDGVPVCEAYAIRNNFAKPPIVTNCGGGNRGESATINATFSDGTLMLHFTLVNPFPESSWKYQQQAVPTTAQ